MSDRKRRPKRSDSWNLDVPPLKESEARASERVAARILGKEVRETKVVPETNVVRDQPLPGSETNVVPETKVVPLTTFPHVDGYLALPNTVVDSMWAALDEYETKVYVRLYRLSHGYGRDVCRVGLDRLASGCKLSRSTVQRTLDRLGALGLVEHLAGAAARDVGRERGVTKGNVYRVTVPGKAVRETKEVRRTNVVPETPSKDSEKTHENPEMKRRAFEHEFRRTSPHATDEEIAAEVDDAMRR